MPGESPAGHVVFDDPVVILSRPRNVLRLERFVSARIPAKLCRLLLPLLSPDSQVPGLVAPGGHVKRVRKIPGETAFVDVLLGRGDQTLQMGMGPIAYERLPASIQALMLAFLEKADGETAGESLSPESLRYAMHDVPTSPPDDAAVREDWSRTYWPVSLRIPDKQARKEVATLSLEETARMTAHMQTVRRMCARSTSACSTSGSGNTRRNACVIVDPASDAVVGRGVDTTTQHPLGHAVMNAIDDVAAWQVMRWYPELQDAIHRKHTVTGSDIIFFETQQDDGTPDGTTSATDDDGRVGPDAQPPYLSTGYDCYVLEEPCAMCAMALVHSRLRRIIYARDAACGKGMLSGRDEGCQALHACRTLNHHFVVYRLSPRQDA